MTTPHARSIPLVIYVFALSAFALGFTEFVTIGLVSAIANDLHVGVDQVGGAVAAYAFGATIGAPSLLHWPPPGAASICCWRPWRCSPSAISLWVCLAI